MSGNLSTPSVGGILKKFMSAVRYAIGLTEKSVKYSWDRGGWVHKQSRRYVAWTQSFSHPFPRAVLYFSTFFIFIPLWIILSIWGVIRSL